MHDTFNRDNRYSERRNGVSLNPDADMCTGTYFRETRTHPFPLFKGLSTPYLCELILIYGLEKVISKLKGG